MHKFTSTDNGVLCYRCGTVIDYPWVNDDNIDVEFPTSRSEQQHDEIHMLLPSCAGVTDNRGHHYITIGAMPDDPDDREITAIECTYGDCWIGWDTDLAYVPRYCKGDSNVG